MLGGWEVVMGSGVLAPSNPKHSLILVSSFPRNYVFQRRFVQFNGRSLMYFGSDKVGDQDVPRRDWGEGGGRAGTGKKKSFGGAGHCMIDANV